MNESIAEFVGALLEWGLGVIGVGGGGLVVGGGTLLLVRRSPFQKRRLLPMRILIFPKKPPIFKIQVRFFST